MKSDDLTLLVDAARGLATPEQEERVRALVADSPDAAAAWHRFCLVQSQARAELDVDQAWINRALALVPVSAPAPSLARLVWDSLRSPLAGVRSATPAGAREAQFELGSMTLDARIEEGREGLTVAGVLDPAPASMEVWLIQDGRTVASAIANEHGEFDLQTSHRSPITLSLVDLMTLDRWEATLD